MKKLFQWMRSVKHWLLEVWPFWLAFVITAAALGFALQPGTSEPAVRITGLVLQLLGVGTVAWGIAETRSLFGKPTVIQAALVWAKRFPPMRGRVVTATANIAAGSATVKARAYVTSNAPPGSPIEARVEVLEENLKRANERISRAQQEFDEEMRKVAASMTQEQVERRSGDAAIHNKLETSETGGVHISAVGAIWLFVGVTLSTASPEIARWLQ